MAEFAHELEDRFGPRPAEVEALLTVHALRLACSGAGVQMVEAGPHGVALTPIAGRAFAVAEEMREGRLIIQESVSDPLTRATRVMALLADVRDR